MSDEDPPKLGPGEAEMFEALSLSGDERSAKLSNAAASFRDQMETHSARVRSIILEQPPLDLLGYLWGRLLIDVTLSGQETGRADKSLLEDAQFALEYMHAVWASSDEAPARRQLDEGAPEALAKELDALKRVTMQYCMASSMATESEEFGDHTKDVEFHAKTTWVLIRGNRYQVLEEEFFNFVLKPHNDALVEAYGVTAADIAAGVQAIADSMRRGLPDAATAIEEEMQKSEQAEQEGAAGGSTINDETAAALAGSMYDLLYGGICNLSRHTKLPPALLEDLAYSRGENTEFFAPGPYCGTPLRTLPARIKPLIRLDDEFYATDGQFVRDSAYRAIQRGLLSRLPAYREAWKRNQTVLVESAFGEVCRTQTQRASAYQEVFYKSPDNGDWAECDWICTIEDVLVVVEAKGGISTLSSPATNFDRHARSVRELIVNAYEQCDRFIRYLAQRDNAPIYRRDGNKHVEIGRLSLRDFRLVVPIGLTVEAFTPFSSMSKEIPGLKPSLGKHPFVSMSVDDLLVLSRFLPTAGELFHYLEVRQKVAGIPQAMLFDELDHLGAYIQKNRFDQIIVDQLKEADRVTWDSFSDTVDDHFGNDRWLNESPPSQDMPKTLALALAALDKASGARRLRVDARIRDLGGEGRENFARSIDELAATLNRHPIRRMLFGDEAPVQTWICRKGAGPAHDEIVRQGEIACLVFKQSSIPVLVLWFDSNRPIAAACYSIASPPMIRSDYQALAAEAERQRGRVVSLSRPSN